MQDFRIYGKTPWNSPGACVVKNLNQHRRNYWKLELWFSTKHFYIAMQKPIKRKQKGVYHPLDKKGSYQLILNKALIEKAEGRA